MTAQLTPSGWDVGYPYLSRLAVIRQRTRQHIRHCVASPETQSTTEAASRLLNEALAIEMGRACRNRSQLQIGDGAVAAGFDYECPRYSQIAHRHVDQIAARIIQLGGKPGFTSNDMADLRDSAHTECDSLADRIEEDLIAENIAVESFRDILHFLGGLDPITRHLVESILAVAQQRLAELIRMREQVLRKGSAAGGVKPE
jgi:bacterioferritin